MARRLINKKNYAWVVFVQGGSSYGLTRYSHLHAGLREVGRSESGQIVLHSPWNFGLTLTSQYDSDRLGNGEGDYGYAFRVESDMKSAFGTKIVSALLSKLDRWNESGDFYAFLKTVAASANINRLVIMDTDRRDWSAVVDLDSNEAKDYIDGIKDELRKYLRGAA